MSNSEAVFRGLKEPTREDMMAIARENFEIYIPLAQEAGLHDAAQEIAERTVNMLETMMSGDPLKSTNEKGSN
ncbi:MAG: hypothetical protein AAFP93_02595 [Bacteroidota bacterium]